MTKFTKKTKILITLFTMLMCMSMLAACSDEETPETTSATEPTTTVKEVETTTEEPTTTEEVTTEYEYKGEIVIVNADKKEMFEELVVEKGYKFYMNEIVEEDDYNPDYEENADGWRGSVAKYIAIALYSKNYINKLEEFYNTYTEPGLDHIYISYDQNAVIEYTGEKKMLFHFVKEQGGYATFDVYEVE